MKQQDVAELCAGLPGGTLEYPFGEGTAVYKVGGKIFALLTEEAEPPRVSLKLPPDEVEALKAQYEGTVLPGYHLNKRHWVTVVLDGVLPEDELQSLIAQSHDVVVATLPQRLRPTPEH
ncbi:MmcQ/YjbR family DNA-binding protein [Spirillospora sp. CA-294931]|uniref:MmcQ/YjbR family DNA-binding protein n=1 Tax=Spirillospora sp. CA-294931 TaxID=3240042 RepID=UPI003D8A2C5C